MQLPERLEHDGIADLIRRREGRLSTVDPAGLRKRNAGRLQERPRAPVARLLDGCGRGRGQLGHASGADLPCANERSDTVQGCFEVPVHGEAAGAERVRRRGEPVHGLDDKRLAALRSPAGHRRRSLDLARRVLVRVAAVAAEVAGEKDGVHLGRPQEDLDHAREVEDVPLAPTRQVDGVRRGGRGGENLRQCGGCSDSELG